MKWILTIEKFEKDIYNKDLFKNKVDYQKRDLIKSKKQAIKIENWKVY